MWWFPRIVNACGSCCNWYAWNLSHLRKVMWNFDAFISQRSCLRDCQNEAVCSCDRPDLSVGLEGKLKLLFTKLVPRFNSYVRFAGISTPWIVLIQSMTLLHGIQITLCSLLQSVMLVFIDSAFLNSQRKVRSHQMWIKHWVSQQNCLHKDPSFFSEKNFRSVNSRSLFSDVRMQVEGFCIWLLGLYTRRRCFLYCASNRSDLFSDGK